MRAIIIVLAFLVSASTGCKTKKAAGDSTSGSASSSNSGSSSSSGNGGGEMTMSTTTNGGMDQAGANVGKVSHKYRADGCETVIIFTNAEGTEMTLIPKDKLAKDVDVDGQIIKFDYHPLKMVQPAGCKAGIPAEITNISKMK